MGGSDSKLSAQTQTQQEEQYAIQMKNPVVAAAMEALEIDKPTTGLKFYQLFAAMDTDGSKSIDLEEFHRFFELRHTAFSDLVFSNLGKQTPARGVAFDG
uniref:EF-hand domain-containing protein n=1 Tax=Phytophthora ramorum TaxID=164328 RepID=H3HCU7_PHYRM